MLSLVNVPDINDHIYDIDDHDDEINAHDDDMNDLVDNINDHDDIDGHDDVINDNDYWYVTTVIFLQCNKMCWNKRYWNMETCVW